MIEKLSLSLGNKELIYLSALSACLLFIYYCFRKKRFAFIVVLTLIYGLFTFWNLGSVKTPITYYQNEIAGDFVILEVRDDDKSFDYIYVYSLEGNAGDSFAIYSRDTQVLGSNDLNDWESIVSLNIENYGKWDVYEYHGSYRYLKLLYSQNNAVINEIGFLNQKTNQFLNLEVLNASSTLYNPNNLIDETDKINLNKDYQDETYFDEIYHARNGYEIANNLLLYTAVHPLLGTRMIALGIKIFGMNPFGYRFFGALTSTLALPLFFYLAYLLFKNEKWANVAVLIFACDFMHYTTGRIATLEPFTIFTIILMYIPMLKFMQLDCFSDYQKALKLLFRCGIYVGLAWATKWTGVFASIGLALLFFYHLYSCYHKSELSNRNKLFNRIIYWCCLFFILIPISIYFLSYLGIRIYTQSPNNVLEYLTQVIDYNVYALTYHDGLESTHPFASTWYMWLFNLRPIWYYVRYQDELIQTISCFNNPAINLFGLWCFLRTIYTVIREKKLNYETLLPLAGYLCSLIFWIPVSRETFSYHYYPCIPFLCLLITCILKKNPRIYTQVFLTIVIILFIFFLPATSGFLSTRFYVNNLLTWLPTWYFGN